MRRCWWRQGSDQIVRSAHSLTALTDALMLDMRTGHHATRQRHTSLLVAPGKACQGDHLESIKNSSKAELQSEVAAVCSDIWPESPKAHIMRPSERHNSLKASTTPSSVSIEPKAMQCWTVTALGLHMPDISTFSVFKRFPLHLAFVLCILPL